MLLNDVRVLAREILDELGLQDWTFRFDPRSIKRFGVCRHSARTILLSAKLVPLNDQPVIEDTIRHEAAHALLGPHEGHSLAWKLKCLEVGAKPERCYDASTVNVPKTTWSLVCPKCGTATARTRRTKTRYSCIRCRVAVEWQRTI